VKKDFVLRVVSSRLGSGLAEAAPRAPIGRHTPVCMSLKPLGWPLTSLNGWMRVTVHSKSALLKPAIGGGIKSRPGGREVVLEKTSNDLTCSSRASNALCTQMLSCLTPTP